MAPVIKAKDLYKCYPGFPPVLRGVNIEVLPGEMVAIMGPSGCGKSTMLHVLGMLHAPDSGSLEILGENVLALNSEGTAAFRRGNMGFVMQASNLFEHSTVFENVEFPLIYENVPPQERWERVIRALELVRLSARVHYRSNRLSGGEQQRVAIARAMVNNPRILLADEPTGALDARTSRVIMENFRNLCHNGGVAMVMVTHDPKMAEYCDSIYTLEDGVLRCHKHEPPRLALDQGQNFLAPPRPLVAGALVARRFPPQKSPQLMALAERMQQKRLLARIYALAKNNFWAGASGYALPLAVRRLGFWQKFGALLKGQGSRAACATALTAWCEQDKIQFLYAADADQAAQTAMRAAATLRLPFAVTMTPARAARPDSQTSALVSAASFVVCATAAIGEALREACPDLPAGSILVLPDPPLFAGNEEDSEPALPPRPGQPLQILAMNAEKLPLLLATARQLKADGINFQLTIPGKKPWFAALRLLTTGLRKFVKFAGQAEDGLAELFRTAEILLAWPPAGPGLGLTMPWQLTEAMALGKACIVLEISPGMAILQNGQNCLLAAVASELAKAIHLLANDPEKRANLGARGRKDLREWVDLDANSQKLAEKMLAASAGRPEQMDPQGQK